MEELDDKFHIFPKVELTIEDFESSGYVLDIGGGGEGVIGQLKGKDVVAIDFQKEELEEAADGNLKIVMDARDLQFLDETFSAATAFFLMMYVRNREDQKKIFEEAWRVLKPSGVFHLWDVDLSTRPETNKEFFLVHLVYQIGENVTETGYGQRWPEDIRGVEHYVEMAEEVGFQPTRIEKIKNTFYLRLIKN